MVVQNKTIKSLLDMLSIRRMNVAEYERERSIDFKPSLNRRLEDERREIAKLKKQLRRMNVDVEDKPLDTAKVISNGGGNNQMVSTQIRRKRTKKSLTATSQTDAPPNFIWILVIFIVSIGASTIVSLVVGDLLKTIAVFIFTLLILGIILPFIALRYNLLPKNEWLKSYVATLEKVSLLGDILKAFRRDK